MRRVKFLLSAAATGVLTACAVNPPLLFGDNVTFGLELGTNAATGGGSVTLGYKQYSVAVVPLSVLDQDSQALALRGFSDQDRDALSVFAVFESSTPASPTPSSTAAKASAVSPANRVHIGQVFSTGLAAQLLTQGLECKLGGSRACPPPAEESPGSAETFAAKAEASAKKAGVSATNAKASAVKAEAAVSAAKAKPKEAAPTPPPPPPATDRPYQSPLIYARTDVFGFDIGGSSAEQGVVFTLGYTSRNLALVPVYAPGGGQRVTGLLGRLSDDPDSSRDAYSVLGQFNANTQTTELGFGLERYFATGIAAQNLAKALNAAIVAPAPSSTPKQ